MWAVVRAKMLRDQAGQPTKMLAVIQDISTRKQAEQALLAAKTQLTDYSKALEQRVAERTAKLEETIKSLDSFCYSVAHDLRAPVRAIHGYVSLLTEQHPQQLNETGKEYLARIMVSARHMDSLINDLLVYGRMSHLDLPLGEVDVNKVLTGVLENLTADIKERNAHVHVRWPLATVWGHPNVLEQILANLIVNALKFVPVGVAPKITIWSEEAEASVQIRVKDNGIGIAPEHHERIFRIFERLNSSKEYPGTGIGLALVKKGVERLGGTVDLESKVGAGSCFSIELIKAKATSQHVEAALPP
jgi:signal transduction histidine kinase